VKYGAPRRLARLLVAVALVAPSTGCGEPLGAPPVPERPAPAPTALADGDESSREARGPVIVELELTSDSGDRVTSFAAEAPIQLRLTLRNDSSEVVSLAFGSGRTHDAIVETEDGRELWRWSQGRMFTQAMSEVRLEAGDESHFELACDPGVDSAPELPPGRYRATALIPSFSGELRSESLLFEIRGESP